MGNIWCFFLQTFSCSLCAAFLLIIKTLLTDKLSPRWQYGVWSVLAIRILIPVKESVMLPLPLWLETAKGYLEPHIHSAYTEVYTPISQGYFHPWQTTPASVTDWLILLYWAGVVITLGWYLLSYLRLRFCLLKGSPASTALQTHLQDMCKRYGFQPCRIVCLEAISSAFVCGLFRPVLVVPANEIPDEKILIHELLHLQHHDAAQNLFWCVLRAMHWCNPFFHFVFDRIGNDMESLCDQRVLERLDGEARRDYGVILLQMANDRYARAPGTTSISNGGKNIRRRIEAIVRFKKYPKGMSLVSICIVVLLVFFMLTGTADADFARLTNPSTVSELHSAMAYARIRRCSTVAGALDTYASGLIWENGINLAMATPLSEHEALQSEMLRNAADGWVSRHLETYNGLECVDGNSVYQILGLKKISDIQYDAWLVVTVYGFLDEEGFLQPNSDGFVIIPVSISREDGWVVQESGPRRSVKASLWELSDWEQDFPWIQAFAADGTFGRAEVHCATRHWPHKMNVISHNIYTGGTRNVYPDPDAVFQNVSAIYQISYTPGKAYGETDIRCQAAALTDFREETEFRTLSTGASNGGSSDGLCWFRTPDNGPPEYPMTYENNCVWYREDLKNPDTTLPAAFRLQVSHGPTVVEELLLTEVDYE